jgi:hypothetical protein
MTDLTWDVTFYWFVLPAAFAVVVAVAAIVLTRPPKV